MENLELGSTYFMTRGNFAVWDKPLKDDNYSNVKNIGRLVKGDHFMIVDEDEWCYHILSNKTSCWLYKESLILPHNQYFREL